MSAPESRTQDQVRKAHDIIVKFKEGWEMKVATKATKIKMVLSRGLATRHPVKLVGLLALGTILMAGTAIQFAPKAGEESVNSPLMEKVGPPTKSAEVNTVNSVYFSESSGETRRLREELRAADRETPASCRTAPRSTRRWR